eukprot:scaffold108166_cov28-Tisochrysis_lutea.AAC.3
MVMRHEAPLSPFIPCCGGGTTYLLDIPHMQAQHTPLAKTLTCRHAWHRTPWRPLTPSQASKLLQPVVCLHLAPSPLGLELENARLASTWDKRRILLRALQVQVRAQCLSRM